MKAASVQLDEQMYQSLSLYCSIFLCCCIAAIESVMSVIRYRCELVILVCVRLLVLNVITIDILPFGYYTAC